MSISIPRKQFVIQKSPIKPISTPELSPKNNRKEY